MTWQTYYTAEAEGIEEVERESDRAWLLLLLWLLLGERHFTRRLTPARLRLPVDDAGRWDTTRPAPFQRFRSIANREANIVQRRLIRAISGRIESATFKGSRRTVPTASVVHQSIRTAADLRSNSWDRSRLIAADDGFRTGNPAPLTAGGAATIPPPPRNRISQDDSRPSRRRGVIFDLGNDGEENPRRNIAYQTRRWLEEAVRLTGPYSGPREMDLWLVQAQRGLIDQARIDFTSAPGKRNAWGPDLDDIARRWSRGPAADSGLDGDPF